MALVFNLLLVAATPSPIASPIPAPSTSGGLNVLAILLSALVVALLLLILALRLSSRRLADVGPELEQRLAPVAPHTPDDGPDPREREIYRAQPTPFASQPVPVAAEATAPAPYQPPPPPEPASPQQPRPWPPPPQPAGRSLPPPDPALYQPPPGAPTAYPTTTISAWDTSPPGSAVLSEPAPLPANLTRPEPIPTPAPSAADAESATMAIDPALGAPPTAPGLATSLPFPPSPITAAPLVIPPPQAAADARPEVLLASEHLAPAEPASPPSVAAVFPEPTSIPRLEAEPAFPPLTPPEPDFSEPSIAALIAPQLPRPVGAPAAPAPTSALTGAGGQLILLIEDDERIAKFYSILFEAKGYSVRNARDGVEGVDLANALKPALILLDVMMPKMNGLMVLQTLRANPETEQTPVVVLSNYMEPPLIQRALQLGAIEYVVKSQARPEQLVNAIPSWLIGEPALH